jgi:sodium/hydrogen antiporter
MSSSRSLVRWPASAAAICLVAGMLAGAWRGGFGAQAFEHARAVEALSEAGMLVCLFCTGLGISAPLDLVVWRPPLRLAAITLPVTVALIAAAANVFLGLPIEQAILLGAILGPTDPALAAGLRLPATGREDVTRFALVTEGALGSSLALPVVLFGLGLCGHHDLGPLALRWIAVDVVWAVGCGALLGWAAGAMAARALVGLDSRGQIGILEVLLFVCVVVLTEGAAFILHANGFVAVLVAGSALARGGGLAPRAGGTWRLAGPLAAGAGRVEGLVELAIVVVLGALVAVSGVHAALILFALLVLVAVRPIAARLGLGVSPGTQIERHFIAWFGMRGVASMYYLMFSVDQNLSVPFARELAAITLSVLATSIALHALTSLPLGKRAAGERG